MGQGASQEGADATGMAWQPVAGADGDDNTGTKNSRNYRECSDCGRRAVHHQKTKKPPVRVNCATCHNAKCVEAEHGRARWPNNRLKMEPTDEEKARIKQLKQRQFAHAVATRSANADERHKSEVAAKLEEKPRPTPAQNT